MAVPFVQAMFSPAHSAANTLREEARQGLRRVRRIPRWMRLLNKVYHEYGLKHLLLISILVVYQFIGAGIFYFCEVSNDESKEQTWKENVKLNRTRFIQLIIPTMFNNTEFLFFLTANQTAQVEKRLDTELAIYEKQLGIKYTDQKIRWDFWNAMLYAQTICTTIGYGHLYPSTNPGRVFTMLYAIVGIPLVLSILDDLDLEIFDLPIPIAIFVVIAWIFICSATFCIWERDWDYFVAFYFFFISLSTIGLGDITPTEPKYLLMLFIYIIIGLSLVSMCINLIQAQLERTYEAGRNQLDSLSLLSSEQGLGPLELTQRPPPRRRGSSLGIFKSGSSSHSLTRETIQAALLNRKKTNKSSQTVLSFPSPSKNTHICRTVSHSRMRFLPRTLSIDDVMKLVDTEEGDILVLTELIRDESGMSESSDTSDLSSSQIVVSKSFDANFAPTALSQSSVSVPMALAASLSKGIFGAPPDSNSTTLISATPSLNEIEAMEEIEDRILLGRAADLINSPAVHFRSRLSLIPEQHSVIDECEEPDEDDDTRPLESTFDNDRDDSPTGSKKNRSDGSRTITTLIGNLLNGREGRRRSNSNSSGTQ
uniref:Potassium channel domain-containing protein n=1 Tax=Ascaris lumbricoides TaxID=6252 RepID=A0A9J2Q138_ASCLU